jgi:KaiC/GvpD/RAD55 family RecA-like ATPase
MPRNVANDEEFEPPAYMDEVPWEPPPGTRPINTEPLPLQYFDDIQPQLTGLWLMKRLLPATGVAVLYGHPGCGKTFLALDWSMHIALGRDWQGRKVKQGLVVYLCAEGVSGLRNRVEAFRRHHKVEGASFALIPVAIDMQAPDADVNRLIAAVRQAEEHFGERAVLVVIDTISKTFGAGKENTDDMVTYVANCQRVSSELEALTMAVHHRPKDAESEDPRGHSSLKGGSETVIIVEAGDTKKLRVTKQKDGEDGLEMLFKLKVVELGVDEDNEPVTSCVVEPTDIDLVPRGESIASKMTRLSDKQRAVFNSLNETLERAGIYPPTEIPDADLNRIRVGKVVKIEDWRTRHIQTSGQGSDIKPDSLRKEFDRGLTRLKNDEIVGVWGDFAWRRWENVGQSRTSPDKSPDNFNNQDRTSRTNWGPPKGGTPALSGSMSDDAPGALSDPGSPPPWMDEAPWPEPEPNMEPDREPDLDWMDNPVLNRDFGKGDE